MRLFEYVFIGLTAIELSSACRFLRTFYQKHSNIFQLDEENQTSLTIGPLYALSNRSVSALSIGIIYQLADTHLVPVPLLFQCPPSQRIFSPIECEFTLIDTHSNLSVRTTESTRTTTVPLHFQGYSSLRIRGAYFKPSIIALRNCRFDHPARRSDTFHLRIEFEQTIHSSCQTTCLHSPLYHCSSISNTCQCHQGERYGHLCVDTELTSNCSLTPERCRRLCRLSGSIDDDDNACQCPLGAQRQFSNEIAHYCDLPILSECNDDKSSTACSNDYICREKRCIKVNPLISPFPIVFLSLLLASFLIIIILVLMFLKMRSTRCVKFIHFDHALSTRLSSPCSTLSSKSTHKTFEN